MNLSGIIVNEAGKPFPGVRIGILQENNAGYSLDDTGKWGFSDFDGSYSIYYPDPLPGKVIALFSPDGRSAAVYSPAMDYEGKTITLDRAEKPFPWLLLIIATIAGYYFYKK